MLTFPLTLNFLLVYYITLKPQNLMLIFCEILFFYNIFTAGDFLNFVE
jgi:hypothetical protein